MNFEMADANVRQHMNEIKDQVARSRGRTADHVATAAGRTRPTRTQTQTEAPSRRHRPSALRNRVGITLIEAGLHLVTADGVSQSRG
jgi:hypothetical protein